MRRLLVTLIISLLLVSGNATAQQSPPTQINAALQDLSTYLGTPIALEDLSAWNWSQQTFEDRSLGCPQSGQSYAQVVTNGYQFYLEYGNIVYDYRVSNDMETVILCSTNPVSTNPPPTCQNALTPRLEIGSIGRVTGGLPSNLRAQPAINAQEIGEVPSGETFTVLAGPDCGPDGWYWWQVQYATLTGWIAQGQNNVYYVEPIPDALPPRAELSQISAASGPRIQQLSRIASNLEDALAWSPNAGTLAIASSTTPGVWLYDTNALATEAPLFIETDDQVSAVTFTTDGRLLYTGHFDGTVNLWDLQNFSLLYTFSTRDETIRDLSMSPDGKLLAIMHDDLSVTLWAVPGALLD